MLKIFRRNKIQEDKVAQVFVDHFLSTVDSGFPEVAALVNDAPEFEKSPNIHSEDSDRFILISLAANLKAVQRYFPPHKDQAVYRKILEQIAEQTNTDLPSLTQAAGKNESFISRVNHPSKNLIYGMSKAFFFKYELAKYQEEYFRNVNAPNPILLKRLDEIMVHFMWDWEEAAGG